MVNRWKPIALGILTFLLAVSIRNEFLFFLLGFEVMLYAASVVQVIWLSRRVKMDIRLPDKCAYRGKTFQLQAVLRNTGLLPIPQLMVRLAVRFFPEREELLLKGKLMLDSREEGALCFAMDGTHCGCVEVRADRLVVTDYLGLVQRRCPVSSQQRHHLYILPDCVNKRLKLPDVQGSVLQEMGERERRGSSYVDVSEIRTYQPGDSIKLMHWKLSARMQQLMVREMADPTQSMTWLFLNLRETPGEPRVRGNPDAWDHFVETVAMVSAELLDMEIAHVVFWIHALDHTVVRSDVSDLESLEQMLCLLLRSDTVSSRDNAHILKEIYPDDAEGTCIEIDLQGNITCSEEQG